MIESRNVVLTFERVDEILKCDHSNESYWAILSCGTVYYAEQGDSNFWVFGWNPKVWPFKWNLFGNTFTWNYLLLKFFQNENYNLFWNLTLFTSRGETAQCLTTIFKFDGKEMISDCWNKYNQHNSINSGDY